MENFHQNVINQIRPFLTKFLDVSDVINEVTFLNPSERQQIQNRSRYDSKPEACVLFLDILHRHSVVSFVEFYRSVIKYRPDVAETILSKVPPGERYRFPDSQNGACGDGPACSNQSTSTLNRPPQADNQGACGDGPACSNQSTSTLNRPPQADNQDLTERFNELRVDNTRATSLEDIPQYLWNQIERMVYSEYSFEQLFDNLPRRLCKKTKDFTSNGEFSQFIDMLEIEDWTINRFIDELVMKIDKSSVKVKILNILKDYHNYDEVMNVNTNQPVECQDGSDNVYANKNVQDNQEGTKNTILKTIDDRRGITNIRETSPPTRPSHRPGNQYASPTEVTTPYHQTLKWGMFDSYHSQEGSETPSQQHTEIHSRQDAGSFDNQENPSLQATGNINVQDPENPNLQDARNPNLQDAGNPNLQDAGNSNLQDPGNSNLQDAGHSNVQDTENPNLQDAENPNLQYAGNPNLQDAGNPNLQDAEYSNLQDAGNSNVQDAENPNLQDAGNSNLQDAGKSNVQDAENPNLQDAENPNLQDATNPNVQDAGNSNLQDAGNSNVQDAENPNLQDAENPNAQDAENPNLQDAENPNLQDARNSKSTGCWKF